MKITLLALSFFLVPALCHAQSFASNCAEKFPGKRTVQFHGRTWIAALEIYEFSFIFNKNSIELSSNWSDDFQEKIDFDTLTDSFTTDSTTFADSKELLCAVEKASCIHSFNNIQARLAIARQNLVAKTADDLAIVECASSVINEVTQTVQSSVR